MIGWASAFRRWALAFFGDRWKYGEVDADWVRAYKLAFRAGYRAGLRGRGCTCPSPNPSWEDACEYCKGYP